MSHLAFTLNPGLIDADRKRVLSQLAAEPGVASLALIDPDSPEPEIRGMGVLQLLPEADPEPILARLKSLEESVTTTRGPTRRLVRSRSAPAKTKPRS